MGHTQVRCAGAGTGDDAAADAASTGTTRVRSTRLAASDAVQEALMTRACAAAGVPAAAACALVDDERAGGGCVRRLGAVASLCRRNSCRVPRFP